MEVEGKIMIIETTEIEINQMHHIIIIIEEIVISRMIEIKDRFKKVILNLVNKIILIRILIRNHCLISIKEVNKCRFKV